MAINKDNGAANAKPEMSAVEGAGPQMTAAEQAAAQKAVQEGSVATQKAALEGQAPSDAAKDAEVDAGGFAGKGIPPGPSGAIMEVEIRQDQQLDHPAVDSQPRKGLPADAMRCDFNDPTFG